MTWAAYRSRDGHIVIHVGPVRVKFDPGQAKLFAAAILLVVAERD